MAGYSSDHPGPVTLSNGIKVDIDKFPQDKFTFLYVKIDEEVGGELPHGEISLRCIEEPAMDKKFLKTNFFKLTIEQEDPVDKYEIYCFIVSRDWSPEVGVLLFTFVCVPNTDQGQNGKFFSKTNRKLFKKKKIKKVIEEVWADLEEPRFRWKTKADPEPEDWWQDRWSDQDFLQRLCKCVQKKTLFAFDFEGLIVKDILGWPDRVTGKPEPDRFASGYASVEPIQDKIDWNYNFRMYRPIEDACTDGEYKYGREISKNLRIEIHEDSFRVFSKNDGRAPYETRHNIYKYNHRLLDGNLYGNIKLRYEDNLPPLRLMDTINYVKANEQEEPEMLTYMIWRVHFFLSGDQAHRDEIGRMYSTEFELCCVQDILGQELPDSEGQDPGQK